MEEVVVGNITYKKDVDSKTICLSKEHLKETDKKILKMSSEMWYHISYHSIKVYIRNYLADYKNEGYKIIFEHNGKKILLIFNK